MLDQYRGKPFWCWNGKLDKAEIIRQVHILKDMGFGGFFMHSRTGLETEYLGKEWFEIVTAAAEEAKKLGMSAWLYDEDRWPSGTAGGEVTKTFEFQLKFISMYDADAEPEREVHIAGELGRFAVCLNENKELLDYYPVFSDTECKEGYVVKKFLIEHMKNDAFYNGYTYLDTMNRKATEAFLNATHEKYRKKCGDLFGKTLLGIFTDEPHRGSILNGFGIGNANRLQMLPYAYELYGRYQKITGEKLSEKLPELFYKRADSEINRTMYYYIESIQQLFLENFAKPYHEWCLKNKLIFTGHILHEDSLAIQALFQGSVQRFYEHMDYPGVDILTEGNRAYWVAKQVQSVARQLGKKFALSELYGCTGWQFNFRSHRDVGVWQALLGINLRCHHLSWYTMEGEAKRDYPASIFYQSGWYKDYKYIEDYFARLGEILDKGKPQCEVLVVNPVESAWLYPRVGWEKNLFELQVEESKRLEEDYAKMFGILTTGQVDFDYGDEEMLSRYAKIAADGEGVKLRFGKAEYSCVVLNGMRTIRSSTVRILRKFMEAGGRVVVAGKAPSYVDATTLFSQEYLQGSEQIAFDREAVLQSLDGYRKMKIDSSEILTAVRKVKDGYYVVCLNTDRDAKKEGLTLQLDGEYNVNEIRLEDGKTRGIAENAVKIPISFEAGECRVFRLMRQAACAQIVRAEEAKKEVVLDGEMKYELSERNVLPLDFAEYSLDGKTDKKAYEILRIDRMVRKDLKMPLRGGEMIQPWYREKYGIVKDETGRHTLRLRYTFRAETLPETDYRLVMEQSERWEIRVNRKKLQKNVVGHWIDRCFDEIDLPREILKVGENVIEMTAEYDAGLNLECVYILGNFGVGLEGAKTWICELPRTLKTGDITNQGLPFYSGKISYHTGICGERLKVKLQDCCGAVSKVQAGRYAEYIAFAPYESKVFDCKGELKIEVSLTRRNTFGPLHYAPVLCGAYGPEIFVLDGEDYTDKYCLIPQGISDRVIVKFY